MSKEAKKLDELLGRQAAVRDGIQTLEREAADLDVAAEGALETLDVIETKLAARKRVLAALHPKINGAREAVSQAELRARERAAAGLRAKEAEQLQVTVDTLLQLKGELDKLQGIRERLGSEHGLVTAGSLFAGGRLVQAVSFEIEQTSGFYRELFHRPPIKEAPAYQPPRRPDQRPMIIPQHMGRPLDLAQALAEKAKAVGR